MNIYFHPTQWFHHEHTEHMHLRQVFHNEVFWIVTLVLLTVLIAITLVILQSDSSAIMYKPYVPYLPFG